MTPEIFLARVLGPGLAWCAKLPGWAIISDDRARVGLTAISGQEANWTARVQSGNGPAHGLFQFERGGGVQGVLEHPRTNALAFHACAASRVAAGPRSVWEALAMAVHDNLAVCFARLLLLTDRAPLPAMDDQDGWYDYYLRNWRPGAPSEDRWADVFPQALAAVRASSVTGGVARGDPI